MRVDTRLAKDLGVDLVVYLDDGTEVLRIPVRNDHAAERIVLEDALEAIGKEAALPEGDPPWMSSCQDCVTLNEELDAIILPQTPNGYIVELQDGCWLAPWKGDPGRTLDQNSARVWDTEKSAERALENARKHRSLGGARVVPIAVRITEVVKL
jgi:hypothetical protein